MLVRCFLTIRSIPHGGGGPGVGPIGVAEHLSSYVPGHNVVNGVGGVATVGAVAAAPWGSASILPIVWMYIEMMGSSGLRKASQVAILSANYMRKRLEKHYNVSFKSKSSGLVAHEFIIDVNCFKKVGIDAVDIAKRLIDYGFHAPTMSWPVPGSLMIEPTESEGKVEIDRLCDALISIREEIRMIEENKMSKTDNPLVNSPHTAMSIAQKWTHPYTREQAVFPTEYVAKNKFWPHVGRVDDVYGDRNVQVTCPCPPLSSYEG